MFDQINNTAHTISKLLGPQSIYGTILLIILFVALALANIMNIRRQELFCDHLIIFLVYVVIAITAHVVILLSIWFWYVSIPIIIIISMYGSTVYVSRFFTRAKYRLENRKEIIYKKVDEITSVIEELEKALTPKKELFLKEGAFYTTKGGDVIGPMQAAKEDQHLSRFCDNCPDISFSVIHEGHLLLYSLEGKSFMESENFELDL